MARARGKPDFLDARDVSEIMGINAKSVRQALRGLAYLPCGKKGRGEVKRWHVSDVGDFVAGLMEGRRW
jgi:hypothetical protein